MKTPILWEAGTCALATAAGVLLPSITARELRVGLVDRVTKIADAPHSFPPPFCASASTAQPCLLLH